MAIAPHCHSASDDDILPLNMEAPFNQHGEQLLIDLFSMDLSNLIQSSLSHSYDYFLWKHISEVNHVMCKAVLIFNCLGINCPYILLGDLKFQYYGEKRKKIPFASFHHPIHKFYHEFFRGDPKPVCVFFRKIGSKMKHLSELIQRSLTKVPTA